MLNKMVMSALAATLFSATAIAAPRDWQEMSHNDDGLKFLVDVTNITHKPAGGIFFWVRMVKEGHQDTLSLIGDTCAGWHAELSKSGTVDGKAVQAYDITKNPSYTWKYIQNPVNSIAEDVANKLCLPSDVIPEEKPEPTKPEPKKSSERSS